jgi:phosphatidylglycerophosphate synthase
MNVSYRQYRLLLKDLNVEEAFDLLFFRPLAFIFVKIIYRSSLTPNQISLLSMSTGIMGGIFFSRGDAASFFIAGLIFGLTRILDCSDGMIARLKKNGTPTGRIVDGTVDYVNAIAIYTGLAIGLGKSELEFPIATWLLSISAAFCMGLHSMIVDYYKSEFMAHALGIKSSALEDKDFFSKELGKLKQKKNKHIEKLLIELYLKYLDIQIIKPHRKRTYDPKKYYHANRVLLRLWNIIGSSTYIFVLMVSSILYKPDIFFKYVFLVANVSMVLIWIIQVRANRKIAIEAS